MANRTATKIFAIFVTGTTMFTAAASAVYRGGTVIDQIILVAISLTICLGANFIPALIKRRWLALLLWFVCIVGSTFNSLTYLAYASQYANDSHARQTNQQIAIERQIKTINETLASIHARPVAIVVTDLSDTRNHRRRTALISELTEAKRGSTLRDELVRLTATSATTLVAGSIDPVTTLLASVTGTRVADISMAIFALLSIILEIVGASLWHQLLKEHGNEITSPIPSVSERTKDPVSIVREAIASGTCPSTVTGIRKFLRCAQDKAVEIRKML